MGLLGRERLWGSSRVSRWLGGVARGLLGVAGGAGRGSHCSQEVRSALARDESSSLQPADRQLLGGSESFQAVVAHTNTSKIPNTVNIDF